MEMRGTGPQRQVRSDEKTGTLVVQLVTELSRVDSSLNNWYHRVVPWLNEPGAWQGSPFIHATAARVVSTVHSELHLTASGGNVCVGNAVSNAPIAHPADNRWMKIEHCWDDWKRKNDFIGEECVLVLIHALVQGFHWAKLATSRGQSTVTDTCVCVCVYTHTVFNSKCLYIFYAEYVYVFRVIVRTKSDYFLKLH